MASPKEFAVSFVLGAQLSGAFSGTFSKAQTEFARLGKEIQELGKIQSDISAYQKQQAAVEATTAKLENLRQQQEKLAQQKGFLQQQIDETQKAGQSTAALEREMAALEQSELKLRQQISTTQTALERQNQKLADTDTKLKEAGVDTGSLAAKSAELTARTKELEAEQQKAAESAQSFGNKTAAAFEAAQSAIAAAGIASALREIYEGFQECVTIAADFEATMSTVEALSGAKAEELGQLNAMAKELGATTKFTATEAAEAMTYMAMAGWKANEMLSGMDGVLQLAAASGENLAQVSDIVTDNLTAFGLAASDTAHFSDVLAAAATNSNTSVSIMGETFKNCAAIAGALNYSIDDVAVAVGLMANAGIKGSNAGTALKNTLNGLVSGITLTGTALGEYEFTAVKADGTMKDFASTIDELRGCFEQMTPAERMANAQAIAGQRTYNGLLAILNATDEEYASLRASIQDCSGAAAEMAKIKMDNLNGQLTLMNSAWDALKTTIGEQFIPEMRKLYSAGTDIFNMLNQFVKNNPAVVKAAAAFVAVLGTAVVALTSYAAILKVIKALELATIFTNPVMAGIAAAAGLAAAVVALTTAFDDGVPSVKELTEAIREMNDIMDEAASVYDDTVSETIAAVDVADTYIDRLEELGSRASLSADEQRDYQSTLALLLQIMPSLSDCISQTTDQYGRTTYTLNTTTDALRANTEAWKENALAQAFQEKYSAYMSAYGDLLLDQAEKTNRLAEAKEKLAAAEANTASVQERIDRLVEEATAKMEAYNAENAHGLELGKFLTQEYDDLVDSIEDLRREEDIAQREVQNYEEALGKMDDAIAQAEEEFAQAEKAMQSLTGATEEQMTAVGELSSAMLPVREQLQALAEDYNEAYDAALKSIQGQYSLWDEAAPATATSIGSINTALESQISYWQDYNANLEKLNERAADIEGLAEVIASFADGSEDSVNAVAGMAAANDEDLKAMVSNWQTLQEEQGNASQSLAELQTDFQARMDEIQQIMEDTVAGMDMPDEAKDSAFHTIQAFIDEASNQLPAVQSAYAQVGRAAAAALGGSLSPVYANGYSYATGGSSLQTLPTAQSMLNMLSGAYASGTQNAAPGWGLVGEDGPEVVWFNGGERVVPAPETAAMLSNAGGSYAPTVRLSIHVEGNATPETVEQLRACEDEIVQRTLDALEEKNIDAVRSAYR